MNNFKEKSELSERVAQLIEYVGDSKNKFSQKLGYSSPQTIYDITSGNSKASFDFFFRLLNSEYSRKFNTDWLITGKGEMLKTDPKKSSSFSQNEKTFDLLKEKEGIHANIEEIIDGLKSVIAEQKNIIEYYKNLLWKQ